MIVKIMEVIVYTDKGANWHKDKTIDPTWSEIEIAIRRMDKYYFPIVSLFCDEDPPYPADFDLMGGKGEWTMYAEFHTRTYFNPSGNTDPDELVWIWQSDQGGHALDAHVCRSIEIVLATTRHFFNTGKLDPAVQWAEL
jgi:hypothetical protein